jgi:hypothetical protein
MTLSFKSPPLVTQEVIDAAATELGVAFPPDYAEFLLKTNGGVPKPKSLKVDAGDYTIDRLYSLAATPSKPAKAVYDLVPMNRHFRSELELPKKYLALGLVDDQDVLLLTVQGEEIGTVSVWAMIESGFDAGRVEIVAASFSEFLRNLEQPSEGAKERAAMRRKFSSLEIAIIEKKWAKVRKLVAELDQTLWPPGGTHCVFCAIECREAGTLKELHDVGIRFDVRDRKGRTPLQAAERQYVSDQEVIPFLRSKGNAGPFPIFEQHIVESKAVLEYLRSQS